ncbi:MAG: DNA gyrase subunit A [Candidatus Spechtbacterales bacterium]
MYIGKVEKKEISEEMRESYLNYAMSVIVSRALPDVRDGLKPVHRRILYTMHEMGLRHNIKFRKSAAVVGDVLGKYHPHGDTAVYDSMARMAQDFSLRYTLVNGQGNWGSIDGDAPAAMRYTEARMTKFAEEMLKDIDKETVEWADNYDATRKEPKVLPAAVPQLLMNGTMGIAVGMATNIPPHNLSELMEALIYLVDTPKATTADLLKFIKGPDFPTGGVVFGKKSMREAYAQGRGPIVMRGVVEIKEVAKKIESRGLSEYRIEITEIPYQVNKSVLIEKIADLVKDGRIEGIRDIRDESDRAGMSIIIELKKDAHPQKILNSLYKFTELQKTFHLNMLALVDGIQPEVLSIRDVLEKYLDYRRQVVRRRIEFDLAQAMARAHILEGLKKALAKIDAVIRAIKASEDRDDAHKNLIKMFKFSPEQATAILEMRLQTLANLERKKIDDELKEKNRIILEFTFLLKSKAAFFKFIKDEFSAIKDTYGDKRRTRIAVQDAEDIEEEDLIPKEETIISLTRGGYIKRVTPSAYKSQNRGGKGIIGMETKGEDVVEHFLYTSTHDRLLFFTAQGKVYQSIAYEIPKSTRIGRGRALVNFLDLLRDDFVNAVLSLERLDGASPERREAPKFLIMATKHGTIKKTSIEDFTNVRKSGLGAIHLKKGDALKWVGVTHGKDDIVLTTLNGKAIRFHESDVRPMGRSASGVRGINLKTDDEVISMVVIDPSIKHMLILSENGFGKRTAASLFRVQKRGGSGIKAAKISPKTGRLVSALAIDKGHDELIAVSQKGHVIRTGLKNISMLGRSTQGVKIMKLSVGDKAASAVVV